MNTDLNKLSIDEQVQFFNIELRKDAKTSITKLCKIYGLNKSTIVSRFGSAGYSYSFDNREYTKDILIQNDNNDITKDILIQNDNKSITNEIVGVELIKKDLLELQEFKKTYKDIQELLDMKEQLKEIIQYHNKSKNVIDIQEPTELKIDKTKFDGELKGRLVKVYDNVNNDWIKFCKDNNQFKMQDLYSLALVEFMEKYIK